jgi:hypothetical protein
MAIFANAQPGATNCVYDKGIVFGANGLNSNGIAIAFAAGHNMGWFNSSDQQCASIQAPVTTIAAGQQMVISNFGTLFNDMSGNTQFRIANGITSAANYLMTTASVAGSNPTLSTAGSDTNIDLSLVPQGSGNVKFGIYTASVVSQAGYITIKDASGTVRRLLVG